MSTTTTRATLEEFGATLSMALSVGPALDLNPCEALHMFFPAIVGDDDVMMGLASMLDPAIEEVAHVVANSNGAITPEDAETFLHNVFHLLQIAAALGHALGVNEALAMAGDLPVVSLDDIAWADLPDVFGEGQEDA